MIAPILLELRRRLGGVFSLFSGIELNVDPSRGLNGVCDFIIAGSPRQFIRTAPLMTIVAVKNDNSRNGMGQCIASMVAATLFNEKAGKPAGVVFGVVTTGSDRRFLRLEEGTVTIDLREYYVDDPGKILGILRAIVEPGISPPTAP